MSTWPSPPPISARKSQPAPPRAACAPAGMSWPAASPWHTSTRRIAWKSRRYQQRLPAQARLSTRRHCSSRSRPCAVASRTPTRRRPTSCSAAPPCLHGRALAQDQGRIARHLRRRFPQACSLRRGVLGTAARGIGCGRHAFGASATIAERFRLYNVGGLASS